MIAYPAWPTLNGYTPGLLGYSQRSVLANEVKAAEAAQDGMRQRLQQTTLKDIKSDADLLRFAMTAGGVSFQANCAPCHGRGAQGFTGYPNLNDDDWLWGGTIDDIHKTIQYGVRSDDKRTRESQMPRYGVDKILDDAQISDAATYVLSLSGKGQDAAAVARGASLFNEQCSTCHGNDGKGKMDLGAKFDRRHLALWEQSRSHHGEHSHGPWVRHAIMGGPPGSRYDQSPRHLCA